MRASLILIGVVFLFIGGIFILIGGSPLLEERRYQLRGARAEAFALYKTLHRATEESSTAYELSYRFRLSDGRAHVQVERVPVHVWERLDDGSPLTIEYLQDEPSSARVVTKRAYLKDVGWLLLGVALALGGLTAIKRSFSRVAVETESPPQPSSAAVAQETSFWPLARRSPAFWFSAIFLAVGGLFFLSGGWELYREAMFRRAVRITPGVVLTKEIKRAGNRNRTKRYEATYRYSVAGQAFEGRDRVSFGAWKQLVEREPVAVLYRADDVAVARLGPHAWLPAMFMTLVGALFGGIGAKIFVGTIRRARLEWRLRLRGVAASGTVVHLVELPLKVNGVPQWSLNYRYGDFRGQAHDKTITIPQDEAEQWNVGDVGKVLYDPALPAEAVWVGRS